MSCDFSMKETTILNMSTGFHNSDSVKQANCFYREWASIRVSLPGAALSFCLLSLLLWTLHPLTPLLPKNVSQKREKQMQSAQFFKKNGHYWQKWTGNLCVCYVHGGFQRWKNITIGTWDHQNHLVRVNWSRHECWRLQRLCAQTLVNISMTRNIVAWSSSKLK